MKVLGIDPGSRKLGYGVIELAAARGRRLASGTLVLDPRRSLSRRLHEAHRFTQELIEHHHPDVVTVEECFVAQGARAALVLGQVRGVLLLAVEQAGIACIEVAPRSVKLAVVGHGNAAKEQVQFMMPRLLAECPAALGPDEADALAIAWCGAAQALAPGRTVSTAARRPPMQSGPVRRGGGEARP